MKNAIFNTTLASVQTSNDMFGVSWESVHWLKIGLLILVLVTIIVAIFKRKSGKEIVSPEEAARRRGEA